MTTREGFARPAVLGRHHRDVDRSCPEPPRQR